MNIRKTLPCLVLGLAALDASAYEGQGAGMWGDNVARVAQWSAEERRAQRERWDDLPADDRAALRQEFRDRLQDLPPEERERRRREIMQRWSEMPTDARARQSQERRDMQPWPAPDGFGRGYERRGSQDGRSGGR